MQPTKWIFLRSEHISGDQRVKRGGHLCANNAPARIIIRRIELLVLRWVFIIQWVNYIDLVQIDSHLSYPRRLLHRCHSRYSETTLSKGTVNWVHHPYMDVDLYNRRNSRFPSNTIAKQASRNTGLRNPLNRSPVCTFCASFSSFFF